MFTTPGEGLLCGRFTIRHRHLYFYGVCTKSGKLLVYGPLWFLYLYCWTVVCVVFLFVCFLILLEIYLKVKQKVTSNLKATHLESHTAIQEVRGVGKEWTCTPLLSDFKCKGLSNVFPPHPLPFSHFLLANILVKSRFSSNKRSVERGIRVSL